MLRRVAVHAAGLAEPTDTYVAINMGAATVDDAVDPAFKRMSPAFREYAIAGFLYMDHLAEMAKENASPLVIRHATLLAATLSLSREEAYERLNTFLSKHAQEWNSYMDTLGQNSFIARWAQGQL
jgi:hypothetical protein